jgi:hypothetical protein
MNETWNQHRIPAYQEILKQYGISNAINSINYSKQTRSFPIMKGKSNLEIH